ncbi:MAG TPA: hypothetical protein VEO19_06025 [Terriglobia bacterium]|nr:hypothetical protein [Terriglobia bacterium]
MYSIFELLTVTCLVMFVAAILFVVCAAVILVNEGIRNALGHSAGCVRQVTSFFSPARAGQKITVLDQLGSLISKEGKL